MSALGIKTVEYKMLRGEKVTKEFSSRTSIFRSSTTTKVLEKVDFIVNRNQIVGLVGESGSGKTTLAKILSGLLVPTNGGVFLDAVPIFSSKGKANPEARNVIRFIFQKMNAPLNPRMNISGIIEEPLLVHTTFDTHQRKLRMEEVALEVGLPVELFRKYPQALSGGEKRRVGIARSLVVRPQFLIADEPTAGLDEELRNEILELFISLRDKESLGIVIITHDGPAVSKICDSVVTLKSYSPFENEL